MYEIREGSEKNLTAFTSFLSREGLRSSLLSGNRLVALLMSHTMCYREPLRELTCVQSLETGSRMDKDVLNVLLGKHFSNRQLSCNYSTILFHREALQ
jgi:hypothetical protein